MKRAEEWKERKTLDERTKEERRRNKGEDKGSERESRKNRDRVEIEKNKRKNIRFSPDYQYFIPKTNLPMKSILIKFLTSILIKFLKSILIKFLKSIEIKFLKKIVTCSPIYFLIGDFIELTKENKLDCR